MENKGSMLLKVSSILMIVAGICTAVGSVIIALVAGAATALSNSSELQDIINEAGSSVSKSDVSKATTLLWIGAIILVISAVVQIIAGVKGKNNWQNPPMAKTLIIFGIVCVALAILGNIIFSSGGASTIILSIITGVAVPVLYIIGAFQLKNMA